MDTRPPSSNLVDIKSVRKERGLQEAEVRVASLIDETADELLRVLAARMGDIGRPDLIPRALAKVMLAGKRDNRTVGCVSVTRAFDFVVAKELADAIPMYQELMRYLVKHHHGATNPLQLICPHRELNEDIAVETSWYCNGINFKTLAIKCKFMTLAIMIDTRDGSTDLHLRDCRDLRTRDPMPLNELQDLHRRAHCIERGWLRHMSPDLDLGHAVRDAGYICSVWSDSDVDGGWVTNRSFYRYDMVQMATDLVSALLRAID